MATSGVAAVLMSLGMTYGLSHEDSPTRGLSVLLYYVVLNVYVIVCIAVLGRRKLWTFIRVQCFGAHPVTHPTAAGEPTADHFRVLRNMWT
ncbi:hypothetical protein AAVH_17479 [Aphelenchoides avenae]|nr:hypothetical protein AAVH_17479 [Aphelenchus avenae]